MTEDSSKLIQRLFEHLPGLREDLSATAGKASTILRGALEGLEIDPQSRPRAHRCRRILARLFTDETTAGTLAALAAGEQSSCSPRFLYELERLFAGLAGDEATPAAENEAVSTGTFLERYPHGLDRETSRRRHKNRVRILNELGGTPSQWDDWLWQMRNTVDDVDQLTALIELEPAEKQCIKRAAGNGVRWAITPHYLSLFDALDGKHHDAAIRNRALPPPSSRKPATGKEILERLGPFSVRINIDHGQPQYCFESDSHSPGETDEAEVHRALEWFADHEEVHEAVFGGGDLLCLDDSRVEGLLAAVSRYKHIRRLRIDTDFPVVLPQRFTALLTKILGRYIKPGKLEVCLVTRFIHPYEITTDVVTMVKRLNQAGISIYNETPYLVDNARRFELVALHQALRLAGLLSFTDIWRCGDGVPLARVLQERIEEAGLIPGLERTAVPLIELENGLRLPLHAERELVALRPVDGRRVYRFCGYDNGHTVIDDSLAAFVETLVERGERAEDYDDIWFFI